MSELVIVLNQLKQDIDVWHELLIDAEKNGNIRLENKLAAELLEMKEMIVHIEKPEIHRHLRLVSNDIWREFHEQR